MKAFKCIMGPLSWLIPMLALASPAVAAERPLVGGMDKPAAAVLRDLVQFGGCTPPTALIYSKGCAFKDHAVEQVSIQDASGNGYVGRPYTVEMQIYIAHRYWNPPSEVSKAHAARLVRYFLPRWRGAARWTRRAVANAIKPDGCPMVARTDGVSIIVSSLMPFSVPGMFAIVVITKSPSLREWLDMPMYKDCSFEKYF